MKTCEESFRSLTLQGLYKHISIHFHTIPPYTFFTIFFYPSSTLKFEKDRVWSITVSAQVQCWWTPGLFFFPLGVNVNTLAIRGTVSVYTFWDTAPQREELNLCFLDRTEYVLWKPWELPQDHILSFKLSHGRFWMVGEAQAHMLNVVESKGQPNWD